MWQEMTQDAASAATASPSLWRNRPYVLLMSGKTRSADHLSRTDSSGLSSTAAATTASPRQPGRPRHPPTTAAAATAAPLASAARSVRLAVSRTPASSSSRRAHTPRPSLTEYPEPFWRPGGVNAAAWDGRLPNTYSLLARRAAGTCGVPEVCSELDLRRYADHGHQE